MVTKTLELPRWDMSVVFPSLESPEFEAGFNRVIEDIAALQALFDSVGVGAQEEAPLDDATVEAFERVLQGINDIFRELRTLAFYISSFVATNSRNDTAQSRLSELQRHTVVIAQLGTRFTAWIGSLDVEALIQRSKVAEAHSYMLRRAKAEAEHLMSPAEEALAAELRVVAATAWGKLHGNVTSQLTATVERDGKAEELPMPVVRNLAMEPDREVRRRAYEAELAAWQKVQVPLAAALNSIKGEVNTLARKRGWPSALDEALFDNNMDRQTLDAMMQAAHESFPDFRRYLRAKANALGVPALAWYDIFAPVGESKTVWEYDRATDFILEHFGSYSARLRDFAARAFRENWVDAEPREGKRDGGFCSWLRGDESRIFMNYQPGFRSVTTLAHELGHAYHNFNMTERTQLQRQSPMTLAETASTFCETIAFQAALRDVEPEEQLALLEASLQDACQVVVDITSRFLFEQGVFERRQQRELTVDELKTLMLDAQRQTYGDGLDQEKLHPYMWAVKGHYYSADRSYYNYPYMFGLLFGLGLYALYQRDPDGFRGKYDVLLSSTGMADAATLAAGFGIDIRQPDFWRASLDVIREDVARFEELVDELVARRDGRAA